MGAKLVGFYDRAGKELGLFGRTKLAMLTKMSSARAEEAEDSADNVRLFEGALERVLREGK